MTDIGQSGTALLSLRFRAVTGQSGSGWSRLQGSAEKTKLLGEPPDQVWHLQSHLTVSDHHNDGVHLTDKVVGGEGKEVPALFFLPCMLPSMHPANSACLSGHWHWVGTG